MKPFTTPKGTELPLLDMRGKAYLEVKFRLVWFREEHPDWSIQTELVKMESDWALVKATISTPQGQIMSTSHKAESAKGFPDFLEKAETGSIGRALALIGYGTQFTEDLDEGQRIVDSPVQPKAEWKKESSGSMLLDHGGPVSDALASPGDVVVPSGKYKGTKIKDMALPQLRKDLGYWETRLAEEGKPAGGPLERYLKAIKDWLPKEAPPTFEDGKQFL